MTDKYYKIEGFKEIWKNPIISPVIKAGYPEIVLDTIEPKSISMLVSFVLEYESPSLVDPAVMKSRRYEVQWQTRTFLVDSFDYDPEATMEKFMIEIAYNECDIDGNYINRGEE